MKKVLTIVTCSVLAACSCSENQWEEVDVVNVDEAPIIEDQVVVEPTPAKIIVEQEPVYTETVYTPTPQATYSCPCTAVQPQPCYMPVCVQPCGCQPAPQPAPQPKVTTTKKVITTTTTIEEPCGKPVCEPVVTTHEEIIPSEVSHNSYNQPQIRPQAQSDNYVEVTVEKNPYRSEIVNVQSSAAKVSAGVASKYSPEVYNVLATRATNRMLQDTSALYDNGATKTVYIKDTQLLSSDLPYGSQRLKGATKEIISGSKTFDVVNSANNADFILDSSADWYVSDATAPALQYKLAMFDRAGRKVNEWVEIIRQVQE